MTPAASVASPSVLSLLGSVGPMGLAVFGGLLVASVLSWAVIWLKWRSLNAQRRANAVFLDRFVQAKSLEEIDARGEASGSLAAVCRAGIAELNKLSTPEQRVGGVVPSYAIDNLQRSLNRAATTEIAALERHVGVLATVASAAPFVGLFGTVWGIMNSFRAIGTLGSANLAVVAPGISEALINTATGLAAAIPAVIAYNHFAAQIRGLATEMECFSQDFLNLVQRTRAGR